MAIARLLQKGVHIGASGGINGSESWQLGGHEGKFFRRWVWPDLRVGDENRTLAGDHERQRGIIAHACRKADITQCANGKLVKQF